MIKKKTPEHEVQLILFLMGKTDFIHIVTYTLVCCDLTVLTLFITLVYKYKIQQFICK